MILAFFGPVCRGIFGHQSTEALSPSEPLNKILKLCPLLMRTHKPPAFHKPSTGSQELPVLTYLLSPTNPTAPASHTVGAGVTIKGFSERLLEGAPSKDAYRKVTLVLMSSGTTLGAPLSPFPTLRLHIAGPG